MVNKLQLYYFSGTGNARQVAQWVAETASGQGINTDISSIVGLKSPPPPEPGVMFGFCSPTHGFNLPPIMMYFMFRLPRAKGNPSFLINTRAGMKLGKYFLSGLSGLAQFMYAIVLLIKGYRVIGMKSIDLPSNWISLHPGLKEKVIVSLFDHYHNKTKIFAEKIFAGKKTLTSLYDLIQDILISPISIGYYFVGRFVLAKTFYASSKCNNCMICIDNCPVKAISLVSGKPFWSYRCESCMKCMNNCPERAIETGHGYLFLIMYLLYAFVIYRFWDWVAKFMILPDNIIVDSIKFTIESAITLGVLILFYRLLHYVIRVPVIRELVLFTSLTHYKFWRRYRFKKSMNKP